ncbi:phospholipase D-like domain-containing protein, partial [Enterobacter hormaechei]|uniref:phospholipase D-like domain-containing protein n=1 Tax=Enterobacter hormaechei TaxID=158836 RepID=UPI001F0B1575
GLYHRQSPEISTDGTEMTLTNILVNAGVKVRLTDAYKIHHDKVIIIDRSTVETGSFNFRLAP